MRTKFSIVSVIAGMLLSLWTVAQADSSPQEKYIATWAETAVSEMYRSGVPASITLAQGLLESGNGRSELAVKGNNHFGIKCHDWKGEKIYYDDDRKGECFRKYPHAEASFKDHSDFLRYRDRYKFLFDLETTDYKSWAYGLKKAGYATDPKYPQKLIELIERYDLSRYDSMKPAEIPAEPDADADRKGGRKKKEAEPQIPQPPTVLETPVTVTEGKLEEYAFSMSRQLFSQNKVPFVYSMEGETYASIAKDYHLFLKEILKYNDLTGTPDLKSGTVVYLQPKKNKAAGGVDKYVAEGGETVWDVAQRFAVKLDKLLKMNDLTSNITLRKEDTVRLR